MNDRQVRFTTIKGVFGVPVGLRLFDREPGHIVHAVEVSTVCLDGAHLEDPLHILDAEHGFETAVFFKGCSIFSIYEEHYETRTRAIRGHKRIVRQILSGKLKLSIQLRHYSAWEEIDGRIEEPKVA